MKIQIARTAGFCMGVRRAVELVLNAPGKYREPIFTFGPLIHNPQVMSLLEEKGITVLDSIPDQGTGTVIIRAHGVPPASKEKLKEAGFEVVDATCPRVIKVQTIIRKHTRQGFSAIIIGDENHPEVIGLLGYAGNAGHVVNSIETLDALPSFEKAIIVAQTTQDSNFFEKVREWVTLRRPHYQVFDTICDSTAKRQNEVKRLTKEVDAVVVVGGRNSGNTRRLAEIAARSQKPVFRIEDADELDTEAFASVKTVGLTAGASTPNWIIQRVIRMLETLPLQRSIGWRRFLVSLQRTLLRTNIYVSIGAGCLGFACMKLLGFSEMLSHVLIAMLYVQSMHILNHLIGTKADRYNDPDRAAFYDANQWSLAALAIIGGGAGLLTAYMLGAFPFAILCIMSIMGLSYNLKILPARLTGKRYRRLKDIPGSKTVLIAAAWGVVTTLLPSFSLGAFGPETLAVFCWAAGLVLVRTAFFDILDVQGDRIVGQNSIPIILGEKQTLKLLKWILAVLTILLPAAALIGWIPPGGIAFSFCSLFLAAVLLLYDRGYIKPGIQLEFMAETHFIVAGAIALIWSLFR